MNSKTSKPKSQQRKKGAANNKSHSEDEFKLRPHRPPPHKEEDGEDGKEELDGKTVPNNKADTPKEEIDLLDITKSITRSGAVNELSSRFLRDSDEAVAKRKLLCNLPFHRHSMISPRTYLHLPFPVRQDWSHCTSPEQLHDMEEAYFREYLHNIYRHGQIDYISPFEHNLEVWRQLWRVLEKSHLILLVADVRDPLLHIPLAFHEYVTQVLKLPIMIVLTKCDLVSQQHAESWKSYLSKKFVGTHIVLNSGKCISTNGEGGYSHRRKILHSKATKKQLAEMYAQAQFLLNQILELTQNQEDVQIGVVGQPNTGKSSLINTLLQRHAVSVSRTTGHTKHWQTQLVYNEDRSRVLATIIDSPGLIFPMVVRNDSEELPRAWFECAGLYRISQIREPFSAVRFVGERLDLPRIYNLKLDEDDYGSEWTPYSFLGTLADKRGYTLQRGGGAPDIHRAGLETINDVCDGIVLLCFPPPSEE